jgi:hypothetical protein
VVEWSVHSDQLSIFLIQSIIPFRLIEHQFGRIVNSIEGKASGTTTNNPAETRLRCDKRTWQIAQTPQIPGESRPTWKENEMSILSSIGRIATEFSAARTRYQTERAIRSLPIELQKDIGWPEVTGSEPSSRNFSPRTGVGIWAGAK